MLERLARGYRRLSSAWATPVGRYESDAEGFGVGASVLKTPSAFEGIGLPSQPRRTAAGIDYTPESAISVATVFRAISLISRAECQLPLHLYRGLDEPGTPRERVREHRALELLANPNPFMRGITFRECLVSQLAGRGNAYVEIVRGEEDGEIASLWLVPPGLTKPYITTEGRKAYSVRTPSGEHIQFAQDEIIHFRTGGSLLEGIGPLDLAGETIGSAKAGEIRGAAEMAGGNRPAGIVVFDRAPATGAKESFLAGFEHKHGGPYRAGRVAFLWGEKVSVHSLGYSNADAQVLEGRRFTVLELARWFNVPPHLLYDLERATFSNIEEQGMDFLVYTLGYWLRIVAEGFREALLPDEDRKGHYFEHLVAAFLAMDTTAKTTSQKERVLSGINTPNEIRAENNKPPHKDGDDLIVPSGSVTLRNLGAAQTEVANQSTARRWASAELARAYRRHAAAIGRMAKTPGTFLKEAGEFWAEERSTLSSALQEPLGVRASGVAAEVARLGWSACLTAAEAKPAALPGTVAEAFGLAWSTTLEHVAFGE